MWQRFTERARKMVFYAQEEAGKWGANVVGPEFLLLGLVCEDDSLAARLLIRLDVSLDSARKEVRARLQPGEGGALKDNLQLTPAAKKVIDFAYEEANQLNDNYIGTEHLLLGLLHPEAGVAAKVLRELGVTHEGICERLEEIKSESKLLSENPADELLTLDEAVKFLGTSKPTLYRLLGQDEIKGLKVGRQWRFRKTDLIAYMERGSAPAPPAATNATPAVPREDIEKVLAFLENELTHSDWDINDDETMLTSLTARLILADAIRTGVSNLHFEPEQDALRVRSRINGALQEKTLPRSLGGPWVAEYKTMAGLNAGETQLPQEGQTVVQQEGKDYGVRVSTLPTVSGEAVTLHISDGSAARLGLGDLGLTPEDLQTIYGLIQQSKGIVLATGPAGSGRTTLLYALLSEVAGADKKTLTIEDPLASPLPYVTQMQANPSAGLTIAAALRAFGRQDADIVLAASLGDLETVQLAMEASLSGQLVLAAQEADDTVSALSALLELGAKPPLLAATVTGIIAVRRARKVCAACKQPVDVSALPALKALISEAAEGGWQTPAGTVFFQAVGCEQCRGRGYTGETGLYEVLTMTEPLADAVLRRASAEELTVIAAAAGLKTLLADGVRKAAAGWTTLEEVLRVTS